MQTTKNKLCKLQKIIIIINHNKMSSNQRQEKNN